MLKEYLARMEKTVIQRDRVSNRYNEIVETVIQLIKENKPTTVKNIKSLTGISTIQQIHSIVSLSIKNNKALYRTKVNGNTLILVKDELLTDETVS